MARIPEGKQPVTGREHVYEIEGHSITSADEIFDGGGTTPDRIEDAEHHILEGEDRRLFIDHLQHDLGVETTQGFSLPRLEGFFRASSRAQDYLRGRGYNLGLVQTSLAAGHADDGGFLNETTRHTLRDLIEQSIRPGIDAAEALAAGSPQPREIWHLLTQEPFQSLRNRTTLQSLASEGLLEAATLQRVEELFRTLVQRGIEQAPAYGEQILAHDLTPRGGRNAWMVLNGLRNQATRLGISFDAAAMNSLIQRLEASFPSDPAQMRVLQAATR